MPISRRRKTTGQLEFSISALPPHDVIVLGRTDPTRENTCSRVDLHHLHGACPGRLLSIRLLERRHHDVERQVRG